MYGILVAGNEERRHLKVNWKHESNSLSQGIVGAFKGSKSIEIWRDDMENFPILVLLLGLVVSIITMKYPKYRNLSLIGSGAFPCILYIIKPEFWIFELIVLVVTYAIEFSRLRKDATV